MKNKGIKNAFDMLKRKVGFFSTIMLISIVWGYLNKDVISINSAVIGGLISYIITDIGLSVALQFMHDEKEETPTNTRVREIRYNKTNNPLNNNDTVSIDNNYAENFLNNVKKNDNIGGNNNAIVDISNVINDETDDEIYKNLGIKL